MARQTREYLRHKIWRLEHEAFTSGLLHQQEMNAARETIDALKHDYESAKKSLELADLAAEDWRSMARRLDAVLKTLAGITGIDANYRVENGPVRTIPLVEDLEEYAKSDIAALNRTERLKRLGITKEEN